MSVAERLPSLRTSLVATAIVFGLAMASLLTLFVVPTLYLIEDGIAAALRSRLRRHRPAHGPAGAEVATGTS